MENISKMEIENQITDKAISLFEKAKTKYNLTIPMPTIKFDIKGARVAGKANASYNRIRFNIGIAEKNYKEFLGRTVAHEIAHIVDRRINPYGKPHGNGWKNIMWFFGVIPSRCHKYDVSEVEAIKRKKTQKFPYSCGCVGKTWRIGKTRHNRSMAGAEYRCRKCGKIIIYVGV